MPKEIMSRLRTMCPCLGPIFNRRKGEYSFGSDKNDSSWKPDADDQAVFVSTQHNRREIVDPLRARTDRGTVSKLNISDIEDATVDLDQRPQVVAVSSQNLNANQAPQVEHSAQNLNANQEAQGELSFQNLGAEFVEGANKVESVAEKKTEESFVELDGRVNSLKEGANSVVSDFNDAKEQVTTETKETLVDGKNKLLDGVQTLKTEVSETVDEVKEQKEELVKAVKSGTVQSRLEEQLEAARKEEESGKDNERVIAGRRKPGADGEEVKEELIVVERAAGLHAFGPGFNSERTGGGEIEPRPDIETMEDITDVFKEISEGKSEIDAYQLQSILNNCFKQEFEFDGFSDDLCRSMVAMHDEDLSGRLSYSEFTDLWEDLQQWKENYTAHDADGNGYFDKEEFADILEQIGMTVEGELLQALTIRYSDREGHVRFNDFVACAVKLKIAITTFQQNAEEEETADFTEDQFIQLGMYS